MTEILMVVCCFLFVMATVGAILLIFRWRAAERLVRRRRTTED